LGAFLVSATALRGRRFAVVMVQQLGQQLLPPIGRSSVRRSSPGNVKLLLHVQAAAPVLKMGQQTSVRHAFSSAVS
jgi:hypothetical protein